MQTFSELLNNLPGVKARSRRNRLNSCPRCHDPLSILASRYYCRSCGFTTTTLEASQPEANSLLVPDTLFGNPRSCFYCGQYPDSRDHVIPFTFLKSDNAHRRKTGASVWSCSDCNALLSDRFFPTLSARFLFVSYKLRRKYRAELRSPEWTDSQLSVMGYTLRTLIENRQNLRRWIETRLNWQDSTASLNLWAETRKTLSINYPHYPWFLNFINSDPFHEHSSNQPPQNQEKV
jgi:Zn-finger protein